MLRIDDGPAVILACENGPGFKNLTGLAGFGGADVRATAEDLAAAESLAAIQIEHNHVMAEIGVTRDGAGAAAFRVARMPARDDYLEGMRG